MVFTFALKPGKSYPGSTKMLFQYARPWDKGSGTQQKVTVTFQ